MKIFTFYLLCVCIFFTNAIVSNSSLLENKLIGGIRTGRKIIKYLVSITLLNSHLCSGSMISPRHIFTTAQCIIKMKKKKDRILSEFTVIVGSESHKIDRVNYHDCYDSTASTHVTFYNVGLIRIEDIIFGSHRASWIDISDEYIKTDANISALVAAWDSEAKYNTLTEVSCTLNVTIIQHNLCRQYLNTKYIKDDKQMCGVPQMLTQRSIMEDSGSPLILGDKLIGIVAFINNKPGNPILFMRTSAWRDYIETAKNIMTRPWYTDKFFQGIQTS